MPQIFSFDCGQRFVPLPARGVVVRAGVDDCVRDEIFGKIWIIRVAVKSKLKHASTGDLELIAKLGNVRRDNPEILSDERQSAQFFFYRIKKICARALHPLTCLGGYCSGRYMPRRCEPAKMIQ